MFALAESTDAISQGRAEYRQLLEAKDGLKRVYRITLTLIFLLTVFSAIAGAFLLKLKSGTNLTTIAGMQETGLEVNGEIVDITNKDSAGKRTLLAGAGKASLSITAAGVLTDQAHFTTLMGLVEDRTLQDVQINFDTDLTVTASVQVTKFGATGAEGDASKYSIAMESSGDWSVA